MEEIVWNVFCCTHFHKTSVFSSSSFFPSPSRQANQQGAVQKGRLAEIGVVRPPPSAPCVWFKQCNFIENIKRCLEFMGFLDPPGEPDVLDWWPPRIFWMGIVLTIFCFSISYIGFKTKYRYRQNSGTIHMAAFGFPNERFLWYRVFQNLAPPLSLLSRAKTGKTLKKSILNSTTN